MLRTSMISGLMQSWGEQGRLRTIGSANVVSQILLGLKIEPIEELLPAISDSHFEDTYRMVYNYINVLGGCYYIASCQLYTINVERFQEWSLFALEANQRLLNLIREYWSWERLEERFLYAKKNRMIQTFQQSYYTHLNVFTQMVRYLLLMDAKYGGKWPKSFNKIEFLNFNNRETFLTSIWKLNEEIHVLQYNVETTIKK